MEKENKLLFGKILGEIYRLQCANDGVACPASPGQIYALLNGFEHAVDEELELVGYISSEQVQVVMDVLDPIWMDKEKLKAFKGFYDIEYELKQKGVERSDAIKILRYLKANRQFIEIIEKMDSTGSPMECRNFDLIDWDF